MSVPEDEIGRTEYALRVLARRCLDNPKLDDHPAPVIVNECDRLCDELRKPAPKVEVAEVKQTRRRARIA